ncbi:MAG: NADP-dependent malic enzyme [Treponema sp.]|jgi:malate dehydrogenase (oxaloacetate-decarboxylating)|nr:NADP-dependent malic enzyme [Treponema sp.]
MSIDISLDNLESLFPADFGPEKIAQAKTLFLKNLSEEAHRYYGGKMQTLPRCGIYGLNWFNVWYTPGVSRISTTIRDGNGQAGGGQDPSFELTGRGKLVAVVSDSTRVLGDGDCTPSGGLGVMEGKALLMKYLGGVDAVALCVDSKGADGKNDPAKLIEFVKMVQHSFGAINLEDISQPNCFRVLDELREACDIPVWHDDAQGTACITLAALTNALKLAGKSIATAKFVLLGAGAANSSIARFILADGGRGENMCIFDIKGALHTGRDDLRSDTAAYRQWELCEKTNPQKIETIPQAIQNADVLIALSAPGPDTVKREWVRAMAPKAIVFACANPVPEIWPYAAKEEGAYIVATGRGDFPNQVNNSVCFPGILKGVLAVRAKKITDGMAIRCAHSIAEFSESQGISPDHIIATMEDADIFAHEAADVAMEAISEGVARLNRTWDDVYNQAKADIATAHALTADLQKLGYITEPPAALLQDALRKTLGEM